MAVDKRFLRQQILAQIDRCKALAYGAGSHFAQHGGHTAASMQAQAEADARLVNLIEDYAALGVMACGEAEPWQERAKQRHAFERGVAAMRDVAVSVIRARHECGHSCDPWKLVEAIRAAKEPTDPAGVPTIDGQSAETEAQREEVCAAWHALPDELRLDPRMSDLYRALSGAAKRTAGVPACGKCQGEGRLHWSEVDDYAGPPTAEPVPCPVCTPGVSGTSDQTFPRQTLMGPVRSASVTGDRPQNDKKDSQP